MKKILSVSLVAVLVLGLSVFVLAHGQGNRDYNGYDQDEYYNHLNLSEQQIHDLEELEEEYYDQVDDLRDEIWDKRDDLRELYFDKDSKEEEIVNLHNEINKLRQNLFEINQDYRLELRKMLSSRQLEEMNEYGMYGMGFYNCGQGHGRRGQMNFGPGMHHGGGYNNNGHHGSGMMHGF